MNISINRYWKKLKYCVFCLLSLKRPIYLTIWNPTITPTRINNNIGDDINVPFVAAISGRFVWPVQWSIKSSRRLNYSVIGSLIPWWINEYTIVWGSGIKVYDSSFVKKPSKVCAVRGPYTRKFLLDNGIDCPEIYGDPALLLPLVYDPGVLSKRYRYGVILHEKDAENKALVDYVDNLPSKDLVVRIDIHNYKNWRDIINQILECEVIVSSSLHGLILADAYRIPSVWGKFSYDFGPGYVKFFDYFETVGRNNEQRVKLDSLDAIKDLYIEPVRSKINIKPLIDSCPFVNDLAKRYQGYQNRHKDDDILYEE